MSVLNVTVSRAKPGKRDDAIALAAEAKKLLERHGAQNCRLLVASTAGEATGTYVFTTEFQNHQALGVFGDATAGDAELDALLNRISAEKSPIVIESQSLASEIPLDRKTKTGHGVYVESYISRPLPGRFEAALDLARQVFDFVEAHGAVNARLHQLAMAGSLSEATVASWEFQTLTAQGAATDAFATDPAGQAMMQAMLRPDWPVTTLASGTYVEVPI